MSYEAFCKGTQALATDTNPIIGTHNDTEKGKFIARYSDGTTIVGNPSSFKLTVRWNHNQHQARAVLRNGRICAA